MWFVYQSIAVVFWALMNVIDSVLVHNYQKNPFILGWFLSAISLIILCILAFFVEISSDWVWFLLLGGVTGYVGDLIFYRTIREVDVSIANIGWSIMAIFMGIAGFFLFGERWSMLQLSGVALVIGGIAFLSLWHKKIENPKSLIWLLFLGVSYVPFYVIQEGIFLRGGDVFSVFFWMFLGRELVTLAVPLVIPTLRRELVTFISFAPLHFYLWAFIAIIFFMAGNFLTSAALAAGPASLVSVIGNAQPFIVLFFAWIFIRLLPKWAPRELLTSESVIIKIISFIIVFSGLALLALPQ